MKKEMYEQLQVIKQDLLLEKMENDLCICTSEVVRIKINC